ncbi:MAG TPA: NlpC/P60 family protein [Acidimicrobiales bacterium]|jgi:cell wall-associated NlpC family hydrolase
MTIRKTFFGALALLLVVPVLVVTLGTPAAHALSPQDVTGPGGSPTPTDYWLATATGSVVAMGDAPALAPTTPMTLNRPIVGITPTLSAQGYWLVASDGGIFTYGDAPFFGSTGSVRLNKPIVGMAPTPDGAGYWLVAADGGIFTFGDAAFYGSTGSVRLDQPIIGMAPTADGKGYWLFASDGGIFTFGDAAFFGSTGNIRLDQPIVSVATTPDGAGYWEVAADGGIFTFGDAPFYGSMADAGSPEPTERIATSDSGNGYWIIDQNGTANAFGDATGAPPTMGLMFRAATPGDAVVLFAFQQLGKPYIWGGNGPAGYDCSGLALASWQHAAGVSFARVANDQFHTAGSPVALSSLVAGDLVFWGSSQTDWTTVYHTAIYVGGGRIVEATGDHVQLNSLGQWGSSDLMANGRRP